MSKRVLIVGGGISGLSAAYYLGRSPGFQVTLLESADQLGGKIKTEQINSYLIEQGPDSIFTMKPAAVDLAIELGMEDQLIEPLQSDFSILVKGRLYHVPRALATLMPSASSALESVEFLSASAKKRILGESKAPKGSGDDESIASFFRRRFGKKFSTLVAEPLLAGIYAGDPELLSMQALYPGYLGIEQKKGSLTGPSDGGAPSQQPPSSTRRAGFITFKRGMGSLIERLAASLSGVNVRTGERVIGIERKGAVLIVKTQAGGYEADHVLLALPAYAASGLIAGLAPNASEILAKIRHVSTVIVSMSYPRGVFPKALNGNGFLVPYIEKSDITGCTWSSNKWAERAPDGSILMRVFLGKDGGLNVDQFTDEELVEKAKGAIKKILGAKSDPEMARVHRWTNGMPQKEVGHMKILAEIESELNGLSVHLIGASYRGSGIPDCVREGREIADKLKQEVTV